MYPVPISSPSYWNSTGGWCRLVAKLLMLFRVCAAVQGTYTTIIFCYHAPAQQPGGLPSWLDLEGGPAGERAILGGEWGSWDRAGLWVFAGSCFFRIFVGPTQISLLEADMFTRRAVCLSPSSSLTGVGCDKRREAPLDTTLEVRSQHTHGGGSVIIVYIHYYNNM